MFPTSTPFKEQTHVWIMDESHYCTGPFHCPPSTLELLEEEERGSTSHPATSGWPCPNSSEQRGHKLELNSRRRQSSSRGKFEKGWDRKTTVFLRRTRELLAIASATSNFFSFVQAHWKQSHRDTLDRCARGLLFLCYCYFDWQSKSSSAWEGA